MAVRVEPPRGRPGARYPGLTPEERGLDPPSGPQTSSEPEEERSEPLWILPSEVPPASRPLGFVGPLPDITVPELPPMPEGLFDVPGLLERLWLARALEATHRERTSTAPPASPPPSGAGPGAGRALLPSPFQSGALPTDAPRASRGTGAVPNVPPSPVSGPALPPPDPVTAPVPSPPPRPRSWICPHCYLTNDADATTCRGCRSGALHL